MAIELNGFLDTVDNVWQSTVDNQYQTPYTGTATITLPLHEVEAYGNNYAEHNIPVITCSAVAQNVTGDGEMSIPVPRTRDCVAYGNSYAEHEIPAITQSAEGMMSHTGVLEENIFTRLTLSAEGYMVPDGVGDMEIPCPIRQEAYGFTRFLGEGAHEFPAITCEASGYVINVGTAEHDIPLPADLDAVAYTIPTGEGDMEIPALTSYAHAYVTNRFDSYNIAYSR